MKLKEKEKQLLLELICHRQMVMILQKPESYKSGIYLSLEKLKVKIKDCKEK